MLQEPPEGRARWFGFGEAHGRPFPARLKALYRMMLDHLISDRLNRLFSYSGEIKISRHNGLRGGLSRDFDPLSHCRQMLNCAAGLRIDLLNAQALQRTARGAHELEERSIGHSRPVETRSAAGFGFASFPTGHGLEAPSAVDFDP